MDAGMECAIYANSNVGAERTVFVDADKAEAFARIDRVVKHDCTVAFLGHLHISGYRAGVTQSQCCYLAFTFATFTLTFTLAFAFAFTFTFAFTLAFAFAFAFASVQRTERATVEARTSDDYKITADKAGAD